MADRGDAYYGYINFKIIYKTLARIQNNLAEMVTGWLTFYKIGCNKFNRYKTWLCASFHFYWYIFHRAPHIPVNVPFRSLAFL